MYYLCIFGTLWSVGVNKHGWQRYADAASTHTEMKEEEILEPHLEAHFYEEFLFIFPI